MIASANLHGRYFPKPKVYSVLEGSSAFLQAATDCQCLVTEGCNPGAWRRVPMHQHERAQILMRLTGMSQITARHL